MGTAFVAGAGLLHLVIAPPAMAGDWTRFFRSEAAQPAPAPVRAPTPHPVARYPAPSPHRSHPQSVYDRTFQRPSPAPTSTAGKRPTANPTEDPRQLPTRVVTADGTPSNEWSEGEEAPDDTSLQSRKIRRVSAARAVTVVSAPTSPPAPAPGATDDSDDRSGDSKARRIHTSTPKSDQAENSSHPANSAHGSDAPWTLSMLQQWGLSRNPTLEQARAEVHRTHGKLIQSGLYPNPTIGYSASEVGNDGRGGQQGGFIEQELVTAGKLGLNQSIMSQTQRRAEWALHAQEQRVVNGVRREYYALLAADRQRRVTDELVAIAKKSLETAEQRKKILVGTEIDVLQAQIELEQAHLLRTTAENEYAAAWRRLTTMAGIPGVPVHSIDGNLDEQIPQLEWDQVSARITSESPLVQRAQFGIMQSQAEIERARVEPIPNVTFQVINQFDYASRYNVSGIQIGIPTPIFNRNQGNIHAAEMKYARSVREVERTQLKLQSELATVYQEYATERARIRRFREQILPAAEKSLRQSQALYGAGELSFLQLLTAQRTYTQMNLEYVRSLGRLWQNVTSLEGLLLTDGLAAPETTDE